MADKSAISWTDATWNPTTGCDRVSPGCANCYAMSLAPRLKAMGAPAYQNDGDPKTSGPGFKLTLHPDRLDIPLRWTRPRRIFVDSMSDLFHPDVPDEFIHRVFAVMAMAPQHSFQVLTKRPERMRALLGAGPRTSGPVTMDGFQWDVLMAAQAIINELHLKVPMMVTIEWPLPNVWLGTSVENQHWADIRIPELLATPAAVRFLSCEPLLGPVEFSNVTHRADWKGVVGRPALEGIHWVIVGGESGKGYRAVDPDWVRSLRDQCVAAGVPYFLKQWGGPRPGGEALLDGQVWHQFPYVFVP